jgi:pimeloyl-ACP methyl ester carboxylesterase
VGSSTQPASTSEDRTISVRDLTFHYRTIGDPAAPPVVMLHGIMGHAREWDVLVQYLASTHRMYVVDQRGHGRTDWAEQYSASAMAADLIALVEGLELALPTIIGHSMGGMAAMLAAARRPDLIARLVVIDIGPDSVAGPLAAELREFVRILGTCSYGSIDEAVVQWSGNPLARPQLVRHYVEHGLKSGDDQRLVWRFDGVGLGQFFDEVSAAELWESVGQITCPVLLVRGEHSPVLSADTAAEMVRRFANGQLVIIRDGAHDLGVQQPEAVAHAAAHFLEANIR